MQGLEKKLGYDFGDISLLKTALSHSSYANENRRDGAESNERLEFLGDAVLGFVVAEYLYRNFPELPEGKMTRLRAELVCEKGLNEVAEKLGLGKYLLLGRGEERGGGRERPSILADAVESVLAAVFLDGGIMPAEKIIREFILNPFEAGESGNDEDYKTLLQELLQKDHGRAPEYRLVGESGPDHAKIFKVEALLNGKAISSGTGKSKKDAEQSAAKHALEILK